MNKLKEIYEAMGGRKMLGLLLLIIVALSTVFFLDNNKFGTLMQWLISAYGIFCTGNAVSKLVNK